MLKKLVEFFTGHAIVFLLNLASYPLITRIIPPAEMGKFSMNTTMINFAQILCVLGMDQSFVRYFYDQSKDERMPFLRKCMVLPLFMVGIGGIVICFLYQPISYYIINKESFSFIILFVLQMAASVCLLFIQLYIRMEQKAKLYSFINISTKLLYLACIVTTFRLFSSGSFTLIIANMLASLIMVVYGAYKIKIRLFKGPKEKAAKTNYSVIFRYSLPFLFSTGIIWLFNSVDKIMLREFADYNEMGIYSGAMALVNMLNLLQGAFTTFWIPAAFERYKNNSGDSDFFVRINKIVSLTMLFVAVILIVLKDLVAMFLGAEYREASFIFPYLIFMPIMYTISETTVIGINFKEKSYLHIIVSIVSTISNVAGNLLLVPGYGARGAAIATGLSYVVFFLARTILSLKCYKARYPVARFMVCCAGVYLLAVYAGFHKTNGIIAALAFGNIVLMCVLYKDTLKQILAAIKKE